ncbi:hypothetical protein QR680_015982 [Steinernema hermaphroditum]|uniref:Uncharacterized protein n=1 Tax=Steinernema hermaphroditum TaxID=289476 RepID=A0AA39H9X3_9BILA|nr:hypothetical protein QR680_015982 [Steinernema hermaphroditum]
MGLVVMTTCVHIMSYFVLHHTADWNVKLFYLAFEDPSNINYGTAYMFGQIALDLLILVMCKMVHVLNKKAKTLCFRNVLFLQKTKWTGKQLSSKLQIRQNIALSSTLMPIVVTHFVVSAGAVLVISILAVTNWNHDLLLTILVAETFAVFPLYSLVMPLIFFRCHPYLVKTLVCKSVIGAESKVSDKNEGKQNEFDKFFKMFDEMLEKRRQHR